MSNTIPQRAKIMLPVGISYENMVVAGISHALRSRPGWIVRLRYPGEDWLKIIEEWKPDAAFIGAPEDHEIISKIRSRIPIVMISGDREDMDYPAVLADDVAVGHMGAEYLLNLNLRHFAYWGLSCGAYARRRWKGFFEALTSAGISENDIHLCPSDKTLKRRELDPELRNWMQNLPRPVGMFVSHDRWAYYLNDMAREAGIYVPNDMALLSVDNDELLCELSRPPLSSVSLATSRIGHEAVRIMDDLLSGKPVPSKPVLVPPVGVVSRGSTEMLAVEDTDIIKAILFIRAHATDDIGVADLLGKVPISRRSLESKFKLYFNRTPGAEIRRLRLEKARHLLAHTDLHMPEIARRSGFSSAEYMSRAFVRDMNMSPSTYRHQVTGPAK